MDYDAVQARLLRVIDEGRLSAPEIINTLVEANTDDPEIYAKVVASLLSVSLSPDLARSVAGDILAHHAQLSLRLESDVDIRVAAMSYAVANPSIIAGPVVVDRDLLALSQRLAAVDELTGLYNRRFLDVYLAKEVKRSRRHGNPLSILFVDVDDFKGINDGHGHDVGDAVLSGLGQEIQGLLREEDFAARYGGEEFVVVLPQTDTDGAQRFAERLETRLAMAHLPGGIAVTVSGGIATFPENGSSVPELVRAADDALYLAKQNGKAHTRVAGPEKRSSKRTPSSVPVMVFTDDQPLGQVTLRDVSEAGVSALTPAQIQPGEVIRISVQGESPLAAQEVVARVIWSREIGESVYCLGGEWTEGNTDAVKVLLDRASAG